MSRLGVSAIQTYRDQTAARVFPGEGDDTDVDGLDSGTTSPSAVCDGVVDRDGGVENNLALAVEMSATPGGVGNTSKIAPEFSILDAKAREAKQARLERRRTKKLQDKERELQEEKEKEAQLNTKFARFMRFYKSETGYNMRNCVGRSLFLYDIMLDITLMFETFTSMQNCKRAPPPTLITAELADAPQPESTCKTDPVVATLAFASAVICFALSYVVLWAVLAVPYNKKFVKKQFIPWKRRLCIAAWAVFGPVVIFALDLLYCTRFIFTDFERAKGTLPQFFVYYERLRYLVECFCEAILSTIFQCIIWKMDAISDGLFAQSVFMSVYSVTKNFIEINRGARLRNITRWAFIKMSMKVRDTRTTDGGTGLYTH